MEPQARVVDFQVWQDFMPGPARSAPPLHAVVELEVSNGAGVGADSAGGTITITRQSGEVLLSAARLILGQQSADLATAQPGPRRLSFSIEPGHVATTLTEGETLQGTATVTFGGRRFDLTLPQTSLVFTH
jgi:hypothetical protein